MVTAQLDHLLNKLVICEDSEAGECQSLGDIETGSVGFLRCSRESERLGMITPVRFGWNSCERKELQQ